jgi:hypothetical protein
VQKAGQEAVVKGGGGDGRPAGRCGNAGPIDASAAGRRKHPRVVVINAFWLLLMMMNQAGSTIWKRIGGFVSRVRASLAGV